MRKLIVIILSVIIVLGAILHHRGILKMNKQTKEIPAEVLEFVKDSNQKVLYEGHYKNFEIYGFDYSDEPKGSVWGLPVYILFDGKNVRFADDYEQGEIMSINNN